MQLRNSQISILTYFPFLNTNWRETDQVAELQKIQRGNYRLMVTCQWNGVLIHVSVLVAEPSAMCYLLYEAVAVALHGSGLAKPRLHFSIQSGESPFEKDIKQLEEEQRRAGKRVRFGGVVQPTRNWGLGGGPGRGFGKPEAVWHITGQEQDTQCMKVLSYTNPPSFVAV